MIVSSFEDNGYLKEIGVLDEDAYHDTIRVFSRAEETLVTSESFTDANTGRKNPSDFMKFYFLNIQDSGHLFPSSLNNYYTLNNVDYRLNVFMAATRKGMSDVPNKWQLAKIESAGKNLINVSYIPIEIPNDSNQAKQYVEYRYNIVTVTVDTGTSAKDRLSMSPLFDSLFHGRTVKIVCKGPAFYSKHLKKLMDKGVRREFSLQNADYPIRYVDSLFDACKSQIQDKISGNKSQL